MAQLTKDRNTKMQLGDIQEFAVKASAVLYAGALVCLDATGHAVPGSTATTLIAVGRCEARADNSNGADAAITVKVRKGVFQFANSAAADAITIAEIGDDCYIVDDQTVAKTDGTSTRSMAGKIVQVDAQGVWVSIGIN